jgi:hypothetical protein
VISAVVELGKLVFGGVINHFKSKQKIKEAVAQNKIRLAQSAQSHNQKWELSQLENAGWKDDILFYAIIGMFAWSAIDPDASAKVFENWKMLPEWFLTITGWLVASVLGVKKLGDYLPALIAGVKGAVKRD